MEILLVIAIVVLMVLGVGAAALRGITQKQNGSGNQQEEGGGPLATRWQDAMEKTRLALTVANEESDVQRRMAALDAAIDMVRLTHSRATTDLQREAATALEETVRGAWRSAQGELHLAQARAALRRALGSMDELAQRAAWEEFNRERDKARGFGVSESQIRVLENEVQAVAASLGTGIVPDTMSSETTISHSKEQESS